jgi:hypothetical protein
MQFVAHRLLCMQYVGVLVERAYDTLQETLEAGSDGLFLAELYSLSVHQMHTCIFSLR